MMPDDAFSVGLNTYFVQNIIEKSKEGFEFERFILEHANLFIQNENTFLQRIRQRVKRHRTFDWPQEKIDNIESVVGIRIYNIRFVLSDDGREVLNYIEELIYESTDY